MRKYLELKSYVFYLFALLVLLAACSSSPHSPQITETKKAVVAEIEKPTLQEAVMPQNLTANPTITHNPKPIYTPSPTQTPVEDSVSLEKLQGGIQEIFITQEMGDRNIERKVLIHAPANLDTSKRYPIVIALHGNGGAPDKWIRSLGKFVENNDFIGVYPQGYLKSWNLGKERSNADDVEFISLLIEELYRFHGLDHRNRFVLGSSNGGGMAQSLAIETNYFNAMASIVTQLIKEKEPIKGNAPISVLQILGIQDSTIPYSGGISRVGHEFLGGEESAYIWGAYNECDLIPEEVLTLEGNKKITFANCKNNKTVIHYGISEANHGIPWNTEGGLFELIWDFFKSNIQE